MTSRLQCWCGGAELETFSPEYHRCAACGALVLSRPPDGDITRVRNDESDFYGEGYWFSHQQHLGLPDITRRARTDLPERNLHWLKTLLKYKLPPSTILELGSAHGSFVALLRWAGFEATGLELSPKVVEFARRTFGVSMLQGPIEDQTVEPGSLDAIVLMDVLEHLPDPLGTMRECLDLLKPDGILLIQTPRVPEHAAYEDLVEQNDPFLSLLEEEGHLTLFSEQSVRELFNRLGAAHLHFEPAIFEHYDMFFVVSRVPPVTHSAEAAEASLSATPDGRGVLALMDLRDQLDDVTQRYAEAEADRRARLTVIQAKDRQLHAAAAAAQDLGIAIRASSVYRVLRWLGRWEYHTQKLEQLNQVLAGNVGTAEGVEGNLPAAWLAAEVKLNRIAVDLTPVLPGGDNGGAKVVALTLVQQLSQLLPECTFTLLTSGKSHDELAFLDGPNVHRACVVHQNQSDGGLEEAQRSRAVRIGLQERVSRFLPPWLLGKAKSLYTSLVYRDRVRRQGMKAVGQELDVDLIFCPFTAPLHFDSSTPVVSIVYDLQYLYYPQFFTAEERLSRDQTFREACRLADKLICISDYVRDTVLENSDVAPEKVQTIHLGLLSQLERVPAERAASVLHRLDLVNGRFLLYPANLWRHKNHQMLLTAFAMYRSRHPESDLKLVLTGASVSRKGHLQEAIEKMGLQQWVAMPGYLPAEEFSTLMQSCRALIFPSLYEGFGMPVLEAMAVGKPVLCSNTTSLPEIAGDAALLFDPRKPADIAGAIEQIEQDAELESRLVKRGYERAAAFGDACDMAEQYLQVLKEVAGRSPKLLKRGA